MSGRVMFYVQSLLGIGHLKRASNLARAMAAARLDVTVVLGGPSVPGVTFDGCGRVMLPPVRARDETFSVLIDENGEPIDDSWRDRRQARLMAEFEAIRPDVLLIEQFPFGRRQFRFELLPLLRRARTASRPPHIVSSVRDVLVPRADPRKNADMIAAARTWFDRILVHGDHAFLPLDQSFPAVTGIADRLVYTGYVVDPTDIDAIARNREDGRGEVIVSAGGGAVAEPLLRTALAARPLSRLADLPWRLVTGVHLPDAVFDALAWNAPSGTIVERWRNDLPVLMRNAILSISQGGYNTIMDVLRTRARAVVIPFAAGNETEQTLRARALAARGALSIVEAGDLSPKKLAEVIDETLETTPTFPVVDLTGAETTARFVASMCGDRMTARMTD
jgi:predicted glycosyltransferase